MPRKTKTIPDNASARRFLTQTLQNIWLEQRGNTYRTAHRGPINWATFDFESSPRAVAILLDECSLFRDKRGFIRAVLSFEVFAQLNDQPEEIDDGLMDELYEDIQQVMRKTQSLTDAAGNPLIAKLDTQSANAIETHDATRSVQGLVATMQIEF